MYKVHNAHARVYTAYDRVYKCTLEVTKCTFEVTKFMLEGIKCALECAIVRILDGHDEEVMPAERLPNPSRVGY